MLHRIMYQTQITSVATVWSGPAMCVIPPDQHISGSFYNYKMIECHGNSA